MLVTGVTQRIGDKAMGRSAFSLAFTIEKMRDVFPALSHGWCGHSFKDFSKGFFKRIFQGVIEGSFRDDFRDLGGILKDDPGDS